MVHLSFAESHLWEGVNVSTLVCIWLVLPSALLGVLKSTLRLAVTELNELFISKMNRK